MSEWRTIKLRDVCDSIDYGLTASASEEPTGPKFLRITDIVGSNFSWSSVPHVKASARQVDKYRIHHGDIVIARTGATTGHSKWICNPPDVVFASYLVRLKVSHRIDSRFLGYLLKSDQFMEYVRGVLGDKSAQPNASATTLTSAQLSIPSAKSEQTAIADVLGALDDKITINDHTAATLHQLATAHYRRAYSESTDWNARPLGEVAQITMGQSPAGDSCNKVGIGHPLLNGPTEFGRYSPKPAQWTTTLTRVCIPGDLLLCVRGSTTGRLNWADQKYVVGRGLAAIAARQSPQHTVLIYLSLLAGMSNLLALASGSVFPNLSRKSISTFPIAWPGGDSDQGLVELLSSFMNLTAHYASENRILAELRDTLLPRLMSGEIRVRDAEKAVEEAT